jgi:hypothetical protein
MSDSRRDIMSPLKCDPRLMSVFLDITLKDGGLDETMGSHIVTSYAQYGGWNYVQGGRHTNTGNALPLYDYND